MQKYSDLMKKANVSKDEINNMFQEMYDAIKKNNGSPQTRQDIELDKLIDKLIAQNEKRKEIMEQKSPYEVKPNIRVKGTPTEQVGDIVLKKVDNVLQKAEKVLTEENIKKVAEGSKNVFKKIYKGFINWLTVDEDENNKQQEVNNV